MTDYEQATRLHSGTAEPPAVRRAVVLDDDPTGTQASAQVRVLLDWQPDLVARALHGTSRAVHLLTNSRALPRDQARTVTHSAAAAAVAADPSVRILLRGDSTLRGHVLEEYLAVCDAQPPSAARPVLLLVPALPTAGRVTLGGIHWMRRDTDTLPLDQTEYARDGEFSYRSSWLVRWLEERSAGHWPAGSGVEIPLGALRDGGAPAVRDALAAAHASGGACVPDAVTEDDLKLIADGLGQAEEAGIPVVVRCAPAFAAIATGTAATELVAAPPAGTGVLVVCGSYVPTTSRQLAELTAAYPGSAVEADVAELAGPTDRADAEIARVAATAGSHLTDHGIAIVSTPRTRHAQLRTLDAGARIAHNLAKVAGTVSPRPGVVLAKGGITSAVTLRTGIGAVEADVVGPLQHGVGLWHATWPDGAVARYLVFPGNVGDDGLLRDVVDQLLGRASQPAADQPADPPAATAPDEMTGR